MDKYHRICPKCSKPIEFHGGFKIWFHYPVTNPQCDGPREVPAPEGDGDRLLFGHRWPM